MQYYDSYKSAGQRLSFSYPGVHGNAKLTHNENYILIHFKLYNYFWEKYTLQPHLALTNEPEKLSFLSFFYSMYYICRYTADNTVQNNDPQNPSSVSGYTYKTKLAEMIHHENGDPEEDPS